MIEELYPGDDYIVCLGHIDQLPYRLRPEVNKSSIAEFWDLIYEGQLIAHVLLKPPSAPYQLIRHICQDSFINVKMLIIALDLGIPCSVLDDADQIIAQVTEIKSAPSFADTSVVLLACNCRQFLDAATGYAADVMAGSLRRRALQVSGSLFYSEDCHDYESVIYYITRILHPAQLFVRSNVRQPSLSDSYLIIPAGFDSEELITQLAPPEDKFQQFFPSANEDCRAEGERIVALDDNELMELISTTLEQIRIEGETQSHVARPVHSKDLTLYESPSMNRSYPSTPSATSQIAVKSFFESLLTPRSKDDRLEHCIIQRNAKEALHNMN